MVNVFKNSEPILGTFTEPHEIARISTFGIVDVEKNEEKWFYDLQSLRDVVYYYGISEDDLKTDGTLFKRIKEYIKDKVEEKKMMQMCWLLFIKLNFLQVQQKLQKIKLIL